MLWGATQVRQMPMTSWFGGTGMVVIPTAEVAPYRSIQAHLNVIDVETEDWQTVYGANISFWQGLEAGFTQVGSAYTGAEQGEETLFQAKYQVDLDQILGLGPAAPMLAVGGRDLTNDVNRAYYVALTKEIAGDDYDRTSLARVTVGFGDTEISGTPLDGLFGGIDFTPFDFARLQLEHDGENFNGVLRYSWSEWAITEIAVLDGDMGYGFTLATGF